VRVAIFATPGTPVKDDRDRVPGEKVGLPDETKPAYLIVLEHLGMLDVPSYQASWARKRQWYTANGFVEGHTLFTTEERDGLSTTAVDVVLDDIANVLEL
jgi:hypothetical protein